MVKYIFLFLLSFPSIVHAKDIDCNYQETIVDNIICSNETLRNKNNNLSKSFSEHYSNNPEMITYYKIFNTHKINECKTIECIEDNISKADKWLENKKYILNNTIKFDENGDSMNKGCTINNLDENCKIYAFSAYNSKKISTDEIISKEDETGIQSIMINKPNECVVLVLSAYSPTIWNIYKSPKTKLIAVMAGGYYKQLIRGISKDVQTINSNDKCIGDYIDKRGIARKIKSLDLVKDENIFVSNSPIIGEQIGISNYEFNKNIYDGEFIKVNIRPGKQGLDQLIKAKKIKSLSRKQIIELKKHSEDYNSEEFYLLGKYLMLEQFDELPGGLDGAMSIQLFIPNDLVYPKAGNTHSKFYDLDINSEEANKL